MQIQRGIKYFKGAQIYQKILFRGSKDFNKIEINYPGGPNISIYLDQGELKMGGPLSCDSTRCLIYKEKYLSAKTLVD